ncbi:hypothetical protein RRG08_065188 [Elysia crispata]|uniref:Uncharacterized protein n=1 Tax=Elysia crispata TaxID=231223 RepID=A0AAE0XPR4_9GAST|nr:hypothetical protein RRG08_065188 [Elysia crispata]
MPLETKLFLLSCRANNELDKSCRLMEEACIDLVGCANCGPGQAREGGDQNEEENLGREKALVLPFVVTIHQHELHCSTFWYQDPSLRALINLSWDELCLALWSLWLTATRCGDLDEVSDTSFS